MKRILTILFLLVISTGTIRAQEYKYEARLGWIPIDMKTFLMILGEDPSGETTWGPMKTAGIFSADFDVRMKPWLALGGKVNYRNSWRDMTKHYDGNIVKGIERTEAFSLMPTLRFTTTKLNSVCRVYAALGIGPGVYHNGETVKYYTAFQITPGLAVGKKISWYLEFGLGNAYCGLLTGIGWRF